MANNTDPYNINWITYDLLLCTQSIVNVINQTVSIDTLKTKLDVKFLLINKFTPLPQSNILAMFVKFIIQNIKENQTQTQS